MKLYKFRNEKKVIFKIELSLNEKYFIYSRVLKNVIVSDNFKQFVALNSNTISFESEGFDNLEKILSMRFRKDKRLKVKLFLEILCF